AANAVSNMSTTFSANMISPVLVRNGPLTLASNSFTSGATPNAFGSLLVFDTPYVYQGGDLVMLFRHHGRADESPAPFLDAADESTPGYRTNFRAFFSGSGFNAT